MTSLSYNSVLA